MTLLSNSAQMIVKSGLSLVGLLGVAAIAAAPASAEGGALRGSVSTVSPAGFVVTVTGEVVLPDGMFFPGAAGDYVFTGDVTTDTTPELTMNGGTPEDVSAALLPNITLKNEVITTLSGLSGSVGTDDAALDAYVAILKAAAGAEGLE